MISEQGQSQGDLFLSWDGPRAGKGSKPAWGGSLGSIPGLGLIPGQGQGQGGSLSSILVLGLIPFFPLFPLEYFVFHLILLGINPGPEERGFPAVHVLLGVTGQLDLPQVLVHISGGKIEFWGRGRLEIPNCSWKLG